MNLRTLQIICASLAGGVLVFTAVMGGLAYAGMNTPIPALLAPLAGAVALSLPASVLVGIAVKSSILQQARMAWLRADGGDDAGAIAVFEDAYGRGTLIQVAALEGFGLLGVVSAFVTGQLLFLFAPVLAVMGIGLLFPTEAKFRAIVAHLSRPAEPREQRFMDAHDSEMP